jgi:PAS domain-containing protein
MVDEARAADDAALLAVIVGQSPVGVAVFDTEARYVRVNPALQNAVRYGSGPLTVHLSRHDDGVVVEVRDEGSGTPRRRRAQVDDEGGRGLLLVAGISAAWGVRAWGRGKVVWCRLGRPGPEGVRP